MLYRPILRGVSVLLAVVLAVALGGCSVLATAPPVLATATSSGLSTVTALAPMPHTPTGLDQSGLTIPATAYAIPGGSVFMSPSGSDLNPGTVALPVRTLNRAVAAAREDGTIVLRGGEYRDWFHSPDGASWGIVSKSLTFQAYPGESPWLNGADVVPGSAWHKSGRLWSTSWSTPEFCQGHYYDRWSACAHPDMSKDPANRLAKDPQMVFVAGRPLRQRSARSDVGAGSFYYDRARRSIYVGISPTAHSIELARRPVAMILAGHRSYTVRGIGFRNYATNEMGNLTSGALRVAGSRSTIESSVFFANAAQGLSYSNPPPGSVVHHSVFAYNGYTALGANGASQSFGRNDFRIDDNVFNHNNNERFGYHCTASCGQAGVKLAHMVGVTFSHNLVRDSQGNADGLWCDLGCSDTAYLYNTLINNGHAGIFHEVSDTGTIAGNLIKGNAYGILVSSANTKIYNNTLVGNRQGINVYDDRRSNAMRAWPDIGPDTRNVEVVNNVVWGRNYSLIAAPMRAHAKRPNTDADDLFSLIDNNTFHQTNGRRPIFVYWKTMNGKRTLYRTRATFVRAKHKEGHSRWMTGASRPFFVSTAHGDYRIRAGSTVYGTARDLPADVAKILGVGQHDPARSPGAFAG